MAEAYFLQGGSEGPLCEAGKVKPRLQWRPQVSGDVELFSTHQGKHRIDLTQMRGHYVVGGTAGETDLQKTMGSQITSLRVPDARHGCQDLVFYLLGFVLALVWHFLSSHYSLLEWEHLFCAIVHWKSVI